MTSAKAVIRYARSLTASTKSGIIREAKFQPFRPKKATRGAIKRIGGKYPEVIDIFSPDSGATPEEIQNAEEIRDDIIGMGGVGKFKTLNVDVIRGYYLRLEGPRALVPPLKKDQLANLILQRLGITGWRSILSDDSTATAKKIRNAETVREDIESRGVDKFMELDIDDLKSYYQRLEGSEEPVPNLTRERLAELILQLLNIPLPSD